MLGSGLPPTPENRDAIVAYVDQDAMEFRRIAKMAGLDCDDPVAAEAASTMLTIVVSMMRMSIEQTHNPMVAFEVLSHKLPSMGAALRKTDTETYIDGVIAEIAELPPEQREAIYERYR